MLKKMTLLLMLVMAFSQAKGQSKQIKITGEIFDNSSNDKISYATISYDNGRRGTTSNEEGLFTLTLSKTFITDSITIHHLGYELEKIAIVECVEIEKVRIALKAVSYQMPEATIRSINPYKLLDIAFDNIESQFLRSNHILKGFFRESIWHPGMDQLLYLAEGTLLTYKTGYKNHPVCDPSSYSLTTKDHVVIDSAYVANIESKFKYKGLEIIVPRIVQGPYSPIYLDVFKNARTFFCKSVRQKINYTYDGYIKKGKEEYYVIKFDASKLNIDYEGELYFDINKQVITEVIFYVNDNGLKKFNSSDSALNLRYRKFHIKYTLMGDRIGLSFVNIDNEFEDKMLGHLIKNKIEYVTNSVDTEKVKPYKRKLRIDIDNDLELSLFKTGVSEWKNISVIPRTKNMNYLVRNRTVKPLEVKLDKSAISSKILYQSYKKAVKSSERNQKPLLIYFTADWCPPCKKMKNSTLQDEDIVTYINETYNPVKVDMTRGDHSVSRKFGVTSLPTYLIVNSEQKVESSGLGYYPKSNFMLFLQNEVKTYHAKWNLADFFKNEKLGQSKDKDLQQDSLQNSDIELTLDISVKESSIFELFVLKKDELIEKFGVERYYDKMVESIFTIGNFQFSKSPRYVIDFLKEIGGDDSMTIYFKYLSDHYRYSQNLKESAATSLIQFLTLLEPEYVPAFTDDIAFVTSNIKRASDLKKMQAILNTVLIEHPDIENQKDLVEKKLSELN